MMQAHHNASAPALSAQSLTLRAGTRTLLDGFTHSFHAGEIWCVAGPNGAGKTTLLSTLAGLLQPEAGHVELDGVRVTDWRPLPLAQRRALMPQSAPDAFSASVLEIVMLNRFPHLSGWGWERAADRAAAHAALDRLGLAAFATRDVLSLSGGERQRVALAAVLCQEAPLLLLDEPLSHLDLHHQIDCLEALTEWTREPRHTVMFSCHDLNLARRFATHALLLDGAGGACAGPVHDVLTPALASRAFGYPLILIRDGEHEALIPAPRARHESLAGDDTSAG
ncbi:ABC Fe3+-hydroxamate/cobalamin transporter, ATPase subunit [Paraburkholderia ribeironis]|uniref:ABC Fe3+-hydroxamate/cobalamin transporter, ATPase subunit n=1 Tax=Paraburkholderia ribeironis TaxID=1247936 RepID=A0A1N7SNF7_9BURK|nr:ABC transporter ATP-binding protein [Paraburkholderia ribeironis]SIT48871.1 ABC Fe3+-hydroxamate/cobalamin transporter, ATPase subunit [Paraburkholderia ribeironis]